MPPYKSKARGKIGKKSINLADTDDYGVASDLEESRTNHVQRKYSLRSTISKSDPLDLNDDFPPLQPPKPKAAITMEQPNTSVEGLIYNQEGLTLGATNKDGNGLGPSDVPKKDLGGSEAHKTVITSSAAIVPPLNHTAEPPSGHVAAELEETNQPSSPDTQIPRSFASIFKDAANIRKSGTLRFIAPMVTDLGTKKAVISKSLIASQAGNWSNTLVGYFVGKRPAFPFVNFHANRLWKQFELEDVILNDQGYFFFKFNSEQGLLHVLENGPWLFNDYPVLLQRWQPGVWFEKPKPAKVHLWVNIYDLPVVLWDFEILSRIASVIGVPIDADRYTIEMCEKKKGRAKFARILVEICADQEIPTFVDAEIMGIDRRFRLQYFWTPLRCSHCKIFGHDFDICNVRPRTVAELEAGMANAARSQVGPPGAQQGDPSGAQEQDGFELPKRRRRPKKDQAKKPQNDKGKIAASSAVDVNVTIPTAPNLVDEPNSIDKPDQRVAVDPVHDPAIVELGLDPGFKGAKKIGDGVNTPVHQDIPTCPVLPLDTERVVRDTQSSSSSSNSASLPGCDELPTSSHHKSTTGLDDYDMFLLNRLMHPNLKREAKANVS